MRKNIAFVILTASVILSACQGKRENPVYKNNPAPLVKNAYIRLPLGSVKPDGWLKDQLKAQATGLTGHVDDFWPDLVNSAWRGGEGEAWERGPYYLDGLVPLAWLLDDERLKAKVKDWIEPVITSSSYSGWYGPPKNKDRWPLAVANKVLMQYYEATNDKRALEVLLKYFRYLHEAEPDWPDSQWRGVRAMENAVTGYWLYRQTGEPWILETIESIQTNSRDWTSYYEIFPWDSAASADKRIPLNWKEDGLTAHVVNNAMAIKYPGLWYQQSGDLRFKNAVFDGISKYDLNHGQAGGRFSGDEHLSGKSPDRGTELCAVVEYMFSLEELYAIFGDNSLADRLELLAFNSLPGTCTPDMWAHQYDQQANQVVVNGEKRNWSTNGNFSNIYGLMPNFACCLANMHQGWPKFVSSLWMATNDKGLIALSYAPSTVTAIVGRNNEVTITTESDYPFKESVRLRFSTAAPVKFPVYLRIPGWASEEIEFLYKDKSTKGTPGSTIKLFEKWENGDEISFRIPMPLRTEKRYNSAVSVLKGPLYLSLRIGKEYKSIKINYDNYSYLGSVDWEINPLTPWNYGLIPDMNNQLRAAEVYENPTGKFPFADIGDMIWSADSGKYIRWNQEPALVVETRGIRIPEWQLKDNSADIPPRGPVKPSGAAELIQLVPYGSARLRITEFPLIDVRLVQDVIR
jgi:hypothetical protein